MPLEELEDAYGLDGTDLPRLLDVGQGAGLVQVLRTIDGEVAYSPFFGFENPDALGDHVREHGSGRLAEEFEALRAHQGLVIKPDSHPLLTDAVARGLVMAPSVKLPDGRQQPPLAPRVHEAFATALRDAALPVARRLFMTATPVHLGNLADDDALDDLERLDDERRLLSMDDETVFGPVAYRLSAGEAIARGLLADYQAWSSRETSRTTRVIRRCAPWLMLSAATRSAGC